MEGTLYLNPARQQFYLVPADAPLDDGVYFVIQVPGPERRWPISREVARAGIEPFAIDQEQAREIIGERLGGAAGGARRAFERVLDDAARMAEDREGLGGGAVRSLADRLGGVLATPQVEKGLSLLGNTLLDLADTMRERRGSGADKGPEDGPGIKRESELVLCPYCLSEVDEEDDMCEVCEEALVEQEPFVMTAAEYASEPWKHCPHCGEDMLRLATICASCKQKV